MSNIELVHDKTKAALFANGRLFEYMPEIAEADYAIGALCYARVTHIFAKQNRAQCQLPNGQNASFRITEKEKLTAGQLCWVTLSAQPRQHKPWQAEMGISRAGRLVVLHYGASFVRVSHKAKTQLDEDVLASVSACVPQGWGLVIKRAAIGASLGDLKAEIKALLAPLPASEMAPNAAPPSAPSCLYKGDKADDLWQLCVPAHVPYRFVDEPAYWDEIEDAAIQACAREVILSSSARLYFEITQAVIAVDVDSGDSGLGPAALARHVAPEIMRIIRLASYSGVIVIDLPRLGMKDMTKIIEIFREHAADDMRHPDILGVSRAGLLELVVRHRCTYLKDRLVRP